MKQITLKADPIKRTWAKDAYVFENGILIMLQTTYNHRLRRPEDVYSSMLLTPKQVEDIESGDLIVKHGLGVDDAIADYQFFKVTNVKTITAEFNELAKRLIGTRPFNNYGGLGFFKAARPIDELLKGL